MAELTRRMALALAAAATAALVLTPSAAAQSGTGDLSIGGEVPYGQTMTRFMTYAGSEAYCLQQAAATPEEGEHRWTDELSAAAPDLYAKCLWYGYNGPGFDRSDDAWPEAGPDGEPMDEADWAACTHALLSFAYWGTTDEALEGLHGENREWYAESVLGPTFEAFGSRSPDMSGWIAVEVDTPAGTQRCAALIPDTAAQAEEATPGGSDDRADGGGDMAAGAASVEDIGGSGPSTSGEGGAGKVAAAPVMLFAYLPYLAFRRCCRAIGVRVGALLREPKRRMAKANQHERQEQWNKR